MISQPFYQILTAFWAVDLYKNQEKELKQLIIQYKVKSNDKMTMYDIYLLSLKNIAMNL